MEEEEGKEVPTLSLSSTRIATSESLSPSMLRSFTLAEGRGILQVNFLFGKLLHWPGPNSKVPTSALLPEAQKHLVCLPDPMIVSRSSTIMHLLCTYTISVTWRVGKSTTVKTVKKFSPSLLPHIHTMFNLLALSVSMSNLTEL